MYLWNNRKYLTSSVFLRLQAISDYPGHINTMSLFNYTMRKVWLQQTRIGLSLYDYTGQGFLRESVSAYWPNRLNNKPNNLLNNEIPFLMPSKQLGSGILHIGINTNATSIRRIGEIISQLLCMHCCAEILLLSRFSSYWSHTHSGCISL